MVRSPSFKYTRLPERATLEEEMSPITETESPDTPVKNDGPRKTGSILPFRRIWTRNLCITMLSYTVLESHTAAYNSLWPSFLSDPVASAEARRRERLPFLFSGGAGMSTDGIGWTLAILGAVGFPGQLVAYPRLQQRLGTLRVLRVFLLGFPVVYLMVPYIAVVPSSSPPPAEKSGWPVWALIVAVQCSLMLCATFVVPSHVLLVNRYVFIFFYRSHLIVNRVPAETNRLNTSCAALHRTRLLGAGHTASPFC